MKEHFVWMTTRRIKPGTLADFERAWRPDTHPEGMLRAYGCWSEDEQEIVGSRSGPQRSRAKRGWPPEAAAHRRAAMAAYILGEREAFYRGRELVVPAH